MVWEYGEWEDGEDVRVEVYVDSDWAKDATRKSTSGGMLAVGGVGVKHWSRTQATRALSVGEAEYYALVTGCKEGLGMQALLQDLGWEAGVEVWTDSSTAKGVAARRGLGKLRHVELRFLWVQEMIRKGKICLHKVPGEVNVADHLTKGKMWWECEALLKGVGARLRRGKDGRVIRGREDVRVEADGRGIDGEEVGAIWRSGNGEGVKWDRRRGCVRDRVGHGTWGGSEAGARERSQGVKGEAAVKEMRTGARIIGAVQLRGKGVPVGVEVGEVRSRGKCESGSDRDGAVESPPFHEDRTHGGTGSTEVIAKGRSMRLALPPPELEPQGDLRPWACRLD